MAIGAYSVVRFSDSMRDERVNLGIIVWHPSQGFSFNIPNALDRARTINPSLDPHDIRNQIKYLKSELEADGVDGNKTLLRLSEILREGFQVSPPFPTRLTAAKQCADHLFNVLVYRLERPPELVASEAVARDEFRNELKNISRQIDQNAIVENMGERYISAVRVDVGIRTSVKNHNYLWREVALNAKKPEDQLARAKSTSLDIVKIRGLNEFSGYHHAVAVYRPSKIGESFEEASKWLHDQAQKVVVFRHREEMNAGISEVLAA